MALARHARAIFLSRLALRCLANGIAGDKHQAYDCGVALARAVDELLGNRFSEKVISAVRQAAAGVFEHGIEGDLGASIELFHWIFPSGIAFLREKLAIQNLAAVMSDHPDEVLPRLVKLGMEICCAHSAGISIEPEAGQFRWHALAGELATFEGTTTPRNFSPYGVCLDMAEPILMERAYDWIRDAGITVPEVLLVPLTVKDSDAIGTLWLVAADAGHFNKEHARVMAELSAFTGMALRTVQTEQRLKLVLQQQETLMREMSHRIKSLFSVADSMSG